MPGHAQQRPVSPQPQQLHHAPAQQRQASPGPGQQRAVSPGPAQQRPVSPQPAHQQTPQKIVVTFPSMPENFGQPTRLYGDMALDYLQYRPLTALQTPSAGPEVLKPSTISFTEWAVAQKEVFLKLDEEAKGLVGSYQKLVDEVDIIGQLTRAKGQGPTLINNAALELGEAERKLDKTKHSMKKMFHPDAYRKKMNLREKAVEDAKKELEKAKANHADIAKQLQQALQEKARLEGNLQREKDIRAHQQAILNAMVEGKARDADESAAELSVQTYMQLAWQIDLAFGDQREALQLITQAVETLERVLKLFPEHPTPPTNQKPAGTNKKANATNAGTTFANGTAAAETPANGTAATETPANGTVAAETPANGSAATETPANGTVAVETPPNGASSAEAPATGTVASTTSANGTTSAETPANGAVAAAPTFNGTVATDMPANGTVAAIPAASAAPAAAPADEPKDNQSTTGAELQKQLVIAAQNLIKSAHQYSPYMPSAKNGSLHTFISTVLDPSSCSPEAAKKQLDEVTAAFNTASFSMRWQKQFVKNIARDRELSATNLHTARDKLLFERTRLAKALGQP